MHEHGNRRGEGNGTGVVIAGSPETQFLASNDGTPKALRRNLTVAFMGSVLRSRATTAVEA